MTEDPIPTPASVASHDQAVAEAQQQARVVGSYWRRLKAEGLDDYDALRLTAAFQRGYVFPELPAESDEP